MGCSEVVGGERAQHAQVLVVEDEPELRRTVGRGLAEGGYGVSEADSGVAALEELDRDPGIDAVVTNVALPVMSGPELATEVLEQHPGVPILFVSSTPVPDRLLAHPLVDSLPKPALMRDVRRRIGTLLTAAAALVGRRHGLRARSAALPDRHHTHD